MQQATYVCVQPTYGGGISSFSKSETGFKNFPTGKVLLSLTWLIERKKKPRQGHQNQDVSSKVTGWAERWVPRGQCLWLECRCWFPTRLTPREHRQQARRGGRPSAGLGGAGVLAHDGASFQAPGQPSWMGSPFPVSGQAQGGPGGAARHSELTAGFQTRDLRVCEDTGGAGLCDPHGQLRLSVPVRGSPPARDCPPSGDSLGGPGRERPLSVGSVQWPCSHGPWLSQKGMASHGLGCAWPGLPGHCVGCLVCKLPWFLS